MIMLVSSPVICCNREEVEMFLAKVASNSNDNRLENIEDIHDTDTEECLEDYFFVYGEDVENKIVIEEDDDMNNNSKLGNMEDFDNCDSIEMSMLNVASD